MANWNIDPFSACERTHNHPLGERLSFATLYPPMSRLQCHANVFSTQALEQLKTHWIQTGKLHEISIMTGGGYPVADANGDEILDEEGNQLRQRWPIVKTYYSTAAPNTTARANSLEWADAKAVLDYRRANPLEGDPPTAELPTHQTGIRVNPSQVLWRLSHRNPANPDECRMIPVTVEISHCAESYHSEAFLPGFKDHWKVEHTELEKDFINLSRRECTRLCYMWREPDSGEFIPFEERDTYDGPTLCPHAAYGTPCYGPHPLEPGAPAMRAVTGMTPSKRKIGQPSGGGPQGRPYVKRGRKSGQVLAPVGEAAAV